MRDAEPFSSFEKPLLEGERNRELDSVQLSQMIELSNENFEAQTRLSEAQGELDRRECKGEVLIFLSM